jgi:DNA replication protein DnaC
MSMEAASIAQHCKTLRLSSIGTQFASLAEEASKQNHSHLHYLEALLQAEVEDRERRSIELRLKDAHLPRMKTLEDFDFAQSPHIPASRTAPCQKAAISNAPNQCFWLVNPEPEKRIWQRDWRSPHVGSGNASASPPRLRW